MFFDLRLLSGINFTVLFFYSLAAFFIVPRFEELFEGFGADLPLATRLVMDTYHYWWVIPLLMLVQVLYLRFGTVSEPVTQRILLGLNLFFVLLEILFVPLMVVVFYLPIFKMGQMVG